MRIIYSTTVFVFLIMMIFLQSVFSQDFGKNNLAFLKNIESNNQSISNKFSQDSLKTTDEKPASEPFAFGDFITRYKIFYGQFHARYELHILEPSPHR